MSTKRRFTVSILILMLFGCASSSIDVREPVSVKLSNYKALLVNVSSNNKQYFSDAKKQLENLLISEL
ncbi:MAG: hypothetical protein KAS98_09215, partial [Deltaproteobacteria bacterium]|nr:hypothetical protein [Deltaproteobacteria bacterium]